jgi:hypothetical protein
MTWNPFEIIRRAEPQNPPFQSLAVVPRPALGPFLVQRHELDHRTPALRELGDDNGVSYLAEPTTQNMLNGVVTLGPKRKNRSPQGRTGGGRTINDETRDFIKDLVAEFVHVLVVVILILAAPHLPPGLMRPKCRHKLPVRLQLLVWNRPAGLIAKQPPKRILQELSLKAAGQPPP